MRSAHCETADWGWSSVGIGNEDHLHRLGYTGKEYFQVWDIRDGFCTSPGGLRVPVSPFPGILAVAPKSGRVDTHIPANHGGNLDCRLLGPGSVVYLPASMKEGFSRSATATPPRGTVNPAVPQLNARFKISVCV